MSNQCVVMRPTLRSQLCTPPLQLKGILIGWGMSATPCITEQKPIMLPAAWCISDVLSSWAQLGGWFQECRRTLWSCGLCCVCQESAKSWEDCGTVLWFKHWLRNEWGGLHFLPCYYIYIYIYYMFVCFVFGPYPVVLPAWCWGSSLRLPQAEQTLQSFEPSPEPALGF